MISIEEAKSLIKKHRMAVATEILPLSHAAGRILAEDITAPFDSPRFDNSAMDGFAVKWDDVRAVSAEKRVSLKIVGESSAGLPWQGNLRPGEALRINTGAIVPEGADTVIPQEHCQFDELTVTVEQIKRQGMHIRLKGEEYLKNDRLLIKGTLLNPVTAGILGSIGIVEAAIYKAPKIALLITGTELVNPEQAAKLETGQIFDSNRPMLYNFLQWAGIQTVDVITVEDNRISVDNAVRQAIENSDMIISTGGVSVGPHDHIPSAVKEAGFEIIVEKVAQKPGKPLFFAAAGNGEKLYFGLPGNPVSAFMTFTWYLYPELCYYLGKSEELTVKSAVLGQSVSNPGNRATFVQVFGSSRNGELCVKPVKKQGSHLLFALSYANGFFIIPPNAEKGKGDKVDFYLFPWIQNF